MGPTQERFTSPDPVGGQTERSTESDGRQNCHDGCSFKETDGEYTTVEVSPICGLLDAISFVGVAQGRFLAIDRARY